MHHTFLSLLLPTALCAAALSLSAPTQAATPEAALLTAAHIVLRLPGHGTCRPFALLPPSGRAG
jgi:hypothetical protein